VRDSFGKATGILGEKSLIFESLTRIIEFLLVCVSCDQVEEVYEADVMNGASLMTERSSELENWKMMSFRI
jgi:hypothetical protein